MMEDQGDSQLESEYAAATEQARRFVASRYPLEECEQTSPDYPRIDESWREVWRVRMAELDGAPDFILAIPNTFPDRMPKVYLTASTAEAVVQIPHLDKNRFLCGYDEETAKPNSDRPEDIVIAVLEQASTIFGGRSGSGEDDYAQELQAYWALDCESNILSLIDPLQQADSVTMLRLEPNWRGYSHIFTYSEQSGIDWLKAIGCSSKVHANSIPLLHLTTIGRPPFPRTNGEIYRFLLKHDPPNLKWVLAHLQRAQRPAAIAFSAPTYGGARIMGAWWHPVTTHVVNRGPGHNKRHTGVIPGFASLKQGGAVAAELSMHHKQAKLVRATVTRVDKTRLFERTVGNVSNAFEDSVNMIGCGSLGSLTAACLAQGGAADRFTLVDPQNLGPENVQRHYCGMSYIEEPKVTAIRNKLCAHFPHVSCAIHAKDVLDLVRTSPVALTPSSLTVVTVADIAIERRINQLFKNTATLAPGPLCFLWVEPHLVAGHAVFMKANLPGCFECSFDEELRFNHRVLSRGERFARREAGCQTTFTPYSGLDLNQFVASATRFLIESISADENRLFSWIGDIEYARRSRFALEARWQQARSFSTHVSRLEPKLTCAVCGSDGRSLSIKRERVRATVQ